MREYEKGEIKVVWIGTDPKKIYSKMFNELEPAVKFIQQKQDCLIFKLDKQQKMEEFEWTILPYGRHKEYRLAVNLYKKFGTNIVSVLKGFANH